MKILLIDAHSFFLDFALRCEAEGHEVRVFMAKEKNGDRSDIGDGLLTKVSDWKSSMKWADLITCCDNDKYINELESYRRDGFPIFAPNVEATKWEIDREYGQEILKSVGIECMDSVQFNNADKAIEFVKKNMKRYVSKPFGDDNKAMSYVSKDPDDMVFMLEDWKKKGKLKAPFMLQEFTAGIEMAVGGWFGRNGFSRYFLENFEFKKLMNGEIGPNTGEMGTAMKYCTAEESYLAQQVLLPLEGHLFRCGYTGYIDVAVIIDKKGRPLPLEFTSRYGWPLFQIQQALHPDVANWMFDLLNGVDSFEPDTSIAIGVIVGMPPFPYEPYKKDELIGFPIWGMNEKNRFHIHPAQMKLGKAPVMRGDKIVEESMLVTAGDYPLICSGVGSTVSKAKDKAYDILGSLKIPNSPLYRTDIGDRLEKQLPELQKLGYATSWEY